MKKILIITGIILTVLLFACQATPDNETSPSSTPPAQVEETTAVIVGSDPTSTLEPSNPATDTPVPTSTPETEPTDAPSSTPVPTNTPTPKPVTYGPINFPQGINPLTGLKVADEALLNRRPIAIKVSNFQRGIRPQWALSLADHVYEYYHEGGLTRFYAVYLSENPEQIGPIRSARYTDLHLNKMYQSVFIYGSGDDLVRKRIYNSALYPWTVTEFNTECPPICRVEPDGWNHIVAHIDTIDEYLESKDLDNSPQDLSGLYFTEAPPPNGDKGSVVNVVYSCCSYNRWEYDQALDGYRRYQDTRNVIKEGDTEDYKALDDRLTEGPLVAANVLVLYMPHTLIDATPERWEINLNGTGKAYLFRDGQVFEAVWSHPDNRPLFNILTPDGSFLGLKPGNVWIQIIDDDSILVPPVDGLWRFEHSRLR